MIEVASLFENATSASVISKAPPDGFSIFSRVTVWAIMVASALLGVLAIKIEAEVETADALSSYDSSVLSPMGSTSSMATSVN